MKHATPYQDVAGRWHGTNGKFIAVARVPRDLIEKGWTPIKSAPKAKATKVTRTGPFQDVNGKWHHANGRFMAYADVAAMAKAA